MTSSESTLSAIQYYWRPGCPFCMMLDRSIGGIDLPIEKHNIWDDPEAAAFVRSVANGNETVPTVRVGNEFLVNPSVKEIAAAVVRVDPSKADKVSSVLEPGVLGKMLKRLG